MKAIGYTRVSTEGQAIEGISLSAQKAKIEVWAELNDATLLAVFEDAGLSGRTMHGREGLQKAINSACMNQCALIVFSLSRLARNTRSTLMLAETLEKANADLISISEKIDTTSASGRMLFRLMAVLSEFESDQISERTSGAMAHLRRKNKRISRHVPFGFKATEDGDLIEIPAELEAIQTMQRLRSKGSSFRFIANYLDKAGVKPKRGASWHPDSIRGIIKRHELIAAS